jgi:hypothetical protein
MCSRNVEHAVCVVLHLMDGQWIADRRSRGGGPPAGDSAVDVLLGRPRP